jgi:phage terminase large subunit-like protein
LREKLIDLPPEKQTGFIRNLSAEEYEAVDWFYVLQARDKQIPPPGDWFCWLLLSGRGFGKTRTGAEWVKAWARTGIEHIAIVGQTKGDVRDTMVEIGDSSIMKVSDPWFMPEYQPSKRRLVWPNGSMATIYSGDEPDQLRGPQHNRAWVDELAKFRYPQETWDMLELGLRVGAAPQVVVTTTPRPIPIIKRLIADAKTAVTSGSTYENRDNLSPLFIKRIVDRYENTRLGKQELHGQILDDDPRALWSRDVLEASRVTDIPALYRIVVAIDPHATTGQSGIIVVGAGKVGNLSHVYILDDVTPEEGAKPDVWGRAAISAYHKWRADTIVAEINNGGDMVERVIRTIPGGVDVGYETVRATRGKYTRAEPVSALWEQGRGHMVGYYDDLEDQLCTYVPGETDSPDRLDAMVWGATVLMGEESVVQVTSYAQRNYQTGPRQRR